MKSNLAEGDLVIVCVHVGPRSRFNGMTGRLVRIHDKMFLGYRVKLNGNIEGFTRDELTKVSTGDGGENTTPA